MKALTFAPICRVSTEAQELRKQSLLTQHNDLETDIKTLGGQVYKWFEGSDHATPEFEHKMLADLMADAREHKFDAVMIWAIDRWSRDNDKSGTYLAELKKLGIRFFIRSVEKDLFDPGTFFSIELFVVMGQYQAMEQSRKSIANRINIAKQGFPATTLPYGRTFNKATSQWGIIPECQQRVNEVAALYLDGGHSWRTLGQKFGMNYASLALTMRERCGDLWHQHFKSKRTGLMFRAYSGPKAVA